MVCFIPYGQNTSDQMLQQLGRSEKFMDLPNNGKAGSDRRFFIGGSDARVIMADDQRALERLWREKRGEAEPEDLSGNLIVQLGSATEDFTGSGMSATAGKLSARC